MFIVVSLAMACGPGIAEGRGAEIRCPGEYGGHLQGIATDDDWNVYWSFTVELVKTTNRGRLLRSVQVPNHHGDLTVADGKVYVAVNLGKFNQEPGQADSWIYVYDAGDLELIAKHPVQEVVHGAGGIGFRGGSFYVVGGLPPGYTENYVYEYDGEFKFLKRHAVSSGYTRMGIQTACFFADSWWFGCYESSKGLLEVTTDFKMVDRHDPNYSVGIAPWTNGACLRGVSERSDGRSKWVGKAVVDFPGAKMEE